VRLKLRVDKQHTLFPDKDADVCKTVGALNHIYVTGDGPGFEFYVEETVRKLGEYREWRQSQSKSANPIVLVISHFLGGSLQWRRSSLLRTGFFCPWVGLLDCKPRLIDRGHHRGRTRPRR